MFFKEVIKAVSGFGFYYEVKDFRVSRSLIYIFTFLLFVTVILTAEYTYFINKGLGLAVKWSEEKLPVININKGIVSADVVQPYVMDIESFVMVIDTTGKITTLDDYKQGVLLTKDRVITKKSAQETRIYTLENVEQLTIDQPFLKKAKKMLLMVIAPIMLIGMYLYFCFTRFAQIMFFSLFALIVSSATTAKLSYKQIFNICVYAITPSMILGLLSAVIPTKIPFFILIYCGVYLMYLIGALNAAKEGNV
ncbi:MAG: DUF1189 domain-containing protein [Candidatus Omnitrophota bacterium]|jgi:hypothetical protein